VEFQAFIVWWSTGAFEVCPVISACLCSIFLQSSVRYHFLYLIYFKLFFLGSEDHKKITWVDWHTVCSSKEVGGLGVRSIKEFNVALLGKWCWRLLENRDSLWYRVLASRYGVVGGHVLDGGRDVSTWWRDIFALRREGWFVDNVKHLVGNGNCTLFWSVVWLGGESLRIRFSKLFDLSVFKGESVSDLCRFGWG